VLYSCYPSCAGQCNSGVPREFFRSLLEKLRMSIRQSSRGHCVGELTMVPRPHGSLQSLAPVTEGLALGGGSAAASHAIEAWTAPLSNCPYEAYENYKDSLALKLTVLFFITSTPPVPSSTCHSVA